MNDLIGRDLGPYRILAILGRGGMGVVYRAEDPRLGREVAIKMLAAEIADDPERLRRFEREARAAGALNHPNILTVHEINTHDGKPYLVTELLEGRSLRDVINGGTLAVGEALEHAGQIVAGLAAAHAKGITHRDLKPGNVFLGPEGRVTILDFGLAKLAPQEDFEDSADAETLSRTQSGMILGTPGYMAPEQVRAHATDHRTDIFAFGVVLYEMVTAQRPFRGDSAADTMAAILTAIPEPLSVVRPEAGDHLQRVIDRCLQKDPDDRFQSARDLAIALETAAGSRRGMSEGPVAQTAELPTPVPSHPPAIGFDDVQEPERPVFVAREAELGRLDGFLEGALAGNGAVAFVTGEAGAGKTALVGEFCRRAQERHSELVVAMGACNAATGAGDPYGPWRQVLNQLSGDVVGRVARGVLSVEAGRRLSGGVPVFAEAVAGSGRDLVETLIPGAPLVANASTVVSDAPWFADFRRMAERKAAEPPDVTLQQGAIFLQVGRVLRMVAAKAPLIVVLDDLHWADSATVALLCDLGRQLEGSRLLIVGSYRPEDVAQPRDGEPHPLIPVIAELKRVHGEVAVAVGQTGERGFVDSLVDTEINQLDEVFRGELYAHTRGHALFTVELLRTLQERGLLVRDDEGGWIAGDELDWSTLPARVEGVIGARIERLSEHLRELLTIAAVEGADFTAEVLSRVGDNQNREIIKDLSRDLEKQHRLVTARGIRSLAEGRLSLYGFSHVLFQRYIYNGLDEVEKAQLHEEVGTVLEALYGDEASEIAPQLARHFEEAGRIDRAVHYLALAADGAKVACAFREVESHNRRALALLESLPSSDERVAVKIERLQALAMIVATSRGWAHPEVGVLSLKLRTLCRQAGDLEHLFWSLWLAIACYGNRGELRRVMPLLDEILEMAEASNDTFLRVTAHQVQLYRIFAGDPLQARMHLEMGLDLLDPSSEALFRAVGGVDPRAALLQWHSLASLQLGFRDQAFATAHEAIAAADETGHPFAMAFVRSILAPVLAPYDPEMGLKLAGECLALAEEHGFDELKLYGIIAQAWAAATVGDPEPIEKVIALMESANFKLTLTWCLGIRCKFLLAAGKAEEASAEIARVLDHIEANEQRDIESMVHRLAGDAAAMTGDVVEAEAAYRRALDVARRQQTKPFELEAATALARLWQSQGKRREALELLRPIYEWFTEGFDTAPLIEARELLDELERPVFVARKAELERLDGFLEAAVEGKGAVAFITGEAGTGKTALLGEFVRRAQTANPELVVAVGACNAATGAGDPYGPWRQVLAQMTGDVEARVASGAMSAEQGRRLWGLTPAVAEAVVESGRDLVDTLLAGAGLLKRAEAAAAPDSGWLGPLSELVERKASLPPDVGLQQAAVFMQCSRVVRAATQAQPLLIVLEDLHWADAGSVGMLFQIARELGGSRLMVVGSYRPEEVAVGRGGEPHPMAPVITELQREHGEVAVTVGETDDRAFVDAILDSEPNALDADFRQALFAHTNGHALFTVELLRTLQDRGMLVPDEDGRWVLGDGLDWQALPARVEGVIGARVDRLSEDLRDALTIAAVEGEDFTAEVLARVNDTDTRATIKLLSHELEKRHRLVSARGIRALAGGRLSLYGFSHVLFQRYLYDGIDGVERAQLHHDVGEVLEALYGDVVGEIAPQLARHYSEAGVVDKAILYSGRAGESALGSAAYSEAVAHFESALGLLDMTPAGAARDAAEIDLRLALGGALSGVEAYGSPRFGAAYERAAELCRSVGDSRKLYQALFYLSYFHSNRGENRTALELMDEGLRAGETLDNPAYAVMARQWRAVFGFPLGQFADTGEWDEIIAFYDRCEEPPAELIRPFDLRLLARMWRAYSLWFLGYPDRARDGALEALVRGVESDTDEVGMMGIHVIAAAVERLRRNPQGAFEQLQPVLAMLQETGYPAAAIALPYLGWIQACSGEFAEGVVTVHQFIGGCRAAGVRQFLTKAFTHLAEIHLMAGQIEAGLEAVDQGLAEADETGERYHEAELWRLRGELELRQDEGDPEGCFRQAIEVARRQRARGWELRAATSLARMWKERGRRSDALALLAEIYGWFTEGFDTPDLVDARELLDELERPVFVAREAELERLDGFLDAALEGKGSVAFVTGEAGTGKTALVGEHLRRAHAAHSELVVAVGSCSAQTGIGDAYAPWRQILAQLTGDVETRVAGGAISGEPARRLVELAPTVTEAVLESGRDLIDTLIPGNGLLGRAEPLAPDAPWIEPLRALVERKAVLPPDAALQQGAVFNQMSSVLGAAAAERPLLIVLEDLHWADAGSAALLFHLGREIAGHRMLILGTFRPAEVALGRGEDRHPLEPAAAELQRIHGEILIGLGQTGDRGFVDAFIDSERNTLGSDFREALFGRTEGHALFTVELLRTMQERGMLVRDDEGRWAEGAGLDWKALPARVEGVIGERIDRLSDELRDALTIASVEGHDFTAEVVSRVSDSDTRATIKLLSHELEKRHRLVSARGIRALAEGRLSLYGFSHVLFQRYLYDGLDEVERAQLHQDVGEVLEALYGDHADEIAPQLALHFTEAGIVDKAIRYSQAAGQQAAQRTANLEAVAHFRSALELLAACPEGIERDALEAVLQLALAGALINIQGWAGADVGAAAERALKLSETLDDKTLNLQALWLVAGVHGFSGDLPRAVELGETNLQLAQSVGAPHQILAAHWLLAWTLPYSGRPVEARKHLETVLELYDPEQHHWMAYAYGMDPGSACLMHLSCTLFMLGYLDLALQKAQAAVELGTELDHPHSVANGLLALIWYQIELDEDGPRVEHIRRLRAMAERHGLPLYIYAAMYAEAVRLMCSGRNLEAVTIFEEAREMALTLGQGLMDTNLTCDHGRALHLAGRARDALATLDNALGWAERWGEHLYVPKIHRWRGVVLNDLGKPAEAEQSFLTAIEIAQAQQTRLWELEAATELARLWQDQGKLGEALELLQPIYDWFTEGLDTWPLVQARELLDELESPQNE